MSDSLREQAEPSEAPGLVARLRRFVGEDLWSVDLRPGTLTAALLRLLQLSVMIGRRFVENELLLRASALTYISALALMPMLIVLVALLGLVGGQRTLVDLAVDQLTAVSPDARQLILTRLASIQLGSLGAVGGSLLLVTAVLTLRHLEQTLNSIFGVRQGRSWARRFSDYLAVLVVAPLLTATAVSLATTLQGGERMVELLEHPWVATLYHSGLRYLPYGLLSAAFTFLYWFFPNTRVRPLSALVGGVVAAVLFSLARYAYVDLSFGAARYSALFGGLVALPLVLAWLFACWAVVLFGAEVAFAHQNLRHYRREIRRHAPGLAEREAVGLRVMLEIARDFAAQRPPPDAAHLSEALDLSVRDVRELLDLLARHGLVRRCLADERHGAYVPARPLADLCVADVLAVVRGARVAVRGEEETGGTRAERAVAEVLAELDAATDAIAGRRTLAELVDASAGATTAEAARARGHAR